jgi:uncharacterized membrane protein YgcG
MSSEGSAVSSRSRLRKVVIRLVPVAVTAGIVVGSTMLSACPGSLENKNDFLDASACGDVPADLIAPRCATENCHDSTDPQGELDLTNDEGLVDRIVGVPGVCPGVLADPGAPETSLMYTKCLATNDCQSRMPLTGDKLTAEDEACLLEWLGTLPTSVSSSGSSTTGGDGGGGGGTTSGGGDGGMGGGAGGT